MAKTIITTELTDARVKAALTRGLGSGTTFEEQLADDIAAGRAIHAAALSRSQCECTNQEHGWDLAQEAAS